MLLDAKSCSNSQAGVQNALLKQQSINILSSSVLLSGKTSDLLKKFNISVEDGAMEPVRCYRSFEEEVEKNITVVGTNVRHLLLPDEIETMNMFGFETELLQVRTRINVQGDDIYSLKYNRKSSNISNKDSSFFLYRGDRFENGYIGRARFYFEFNKTWFCLMERYNYKDNEHAERLYSSAMFKIEKNSKGLKIIPIREISKRIMVLSSKTHPINETQNNVTTEIAIVTLLIHKL